MLSALAVSLCLLTATPHSAFISQFAKLGKLVAKTEATNPAGYDAESLLIDEMLPQAKSEFEFLCEKLISGKTKSERIAALEILWTEQKRTSELLSAAYPLTQGVELIHTLAAIAYICKGDEGTAIALAAKAINKNPDLNGVEIWLAETKDYPLSEREKLGPHLMHRLTKEFSHSQSLTGVTTLSQIMERCRMGILDRDNLESLEALAKKHLNKDEVAVIFHPWFPMHQNN